MHNVKKIASNERIDMMAGAKMTAAGTQASTIAAATVTADLTGVGTGTDMTTEQAGQIETDLTAMAAKLNAVLVALKGVGVLADS